MNPEEETTETQEKVMEKVTLENSLQIALSLIMVASLAVVSVGAQADETVNNAPVRAVRYSDLNLNTQDGVAVLYKRIHQAAVAVCGDVDSRRLNEAAVAKACVDRAMFASVASVNSAKLTSEYRAHLGVTTQRAINVASR
jgi:UrcA family protein